MQWVVCLLMLQHCKIQVGLHEHYAKGKQKFWQRQTQYKSQNWAPKAIIHSLTMTTTTTTTDYYFDALLTALITLPSPNDWAGKLYNYLTDNKAILKVGHVKEPPRQEKEWRRKCRGKEQKWGGICYEVLFTAKFGECSIESGGWDWLGEKAGLREDCPPLLQVAGHVARTRGWNM